MLVKSHADRYLEDFGLIFDKSGKKKVHLYENGVVSYGKNFSPVLRINAAWVNQDLTVKCYLADTEEKKMAGLQVIDQLKEDEGMFFPYLPYSSVIFHQGSVNYPLDVLFLVDDAIVQIEKNSKVGIDDKWYCNCCSGVLEVCGGFCDRNNVNVGDRIAMFAVSEQDLVLLEEEKDQTILDFLW